MSARSLDKEPRGRTRHPSPNTQLRRGALPKHPDAWVTGSRPMTNAQAAYLKMLCENAGEAFYARLTKAEASKRIQTLRSRRW
jgi:hypothetical protein